MLEELFNQGHKLQPICIIEQHTDIQFGIKRLEKLSDRYKDKYKELQDEHSDEVDKIWEQIKGLLVEKGMIATESDKVVVRDGVLSAIIEVEQ